MPVSGVCYDTVTVGAFTALAQRHRGGGLRRLLRQQAADCGVRSQVGSRLIGRLGALCGAAHGYCECLCRAAMEGDGATLNNTAAELADRVRDRAGAYTEPGVTQSWGLHGAGGYTELGVHRAGGYTDQCIAQISVFHRSACSADPCVPQIRVFHRSVCSTYPCVLQIRVFHRSVCSTDPCVLQIRVFYRSVCSTDPCVLQIRQLIEVSESPVIEEAMAGYQGARAPPAVGGGGGGGGAASPAHDSWTWSGTDFVRTSSDEPWVSGAPLHTDITSPILASDWPHGNVKVKYDRWFK